MPDRASAISGVLRRPVREQAAFFRGKLGNLVPTRRWDDLDRAEHDTAFMVAGAQKADLLADLAAAVDRAVVEGKSLDAFRKDFAAAVERNDWHGWTGEDSKKGRAWRTRTIYRTNAAVSYAAGRLAQLRASNFKLWIYCHGGSQEPRPEHLAWNGLALPPEHPFWETHYPPSDWGCSCYVVGTHLASPRAIKRLGGDPDKTLPDGWDRTDPKTGEPEGIGRGWGYAPGDRVAETVQAAAEKVRHWEHRIGKAFLDSLPVQQRDAIAEAYRRLPSVAEDSRRYARRVGGRSPDAMVQPSWPLGSLTSEQMAAIGALKSADVAGFDFSLVQSDIRHIFSKHGGPSESKRGQVPVTDASFAHIPAIINDPDTRTDAGATDAGEPLVRFEKVIDGHRYVAVFAILRKRRTLALKTLFVVGK